MGRKKEDFFWGLFETTNDGLKCKYCDLTISRNTSISRIKWHFSGVEGRGVKICKGLPDDIREKALDAISNPDAKKRKIVQTSNDDAVGHTVATSSQHQNSDEFENEVNNYERMEMEEDQGTDDMVEQMIQHELEARGLVGKNIKENMKDLWSGMIKDDISIIGIYAMGGVGKTALARCIHSLIIKNSSIFSRVFWVNPPLDFDIHELQNIIAKVVQLDLSNETDEGLRAIKLSKALLSKKKSVLILDGVWNDVALDEVGIPVGLDGCKVILTTRSFKVCKRTGCQRNIEVMPLDNEGGMDESWDLFMEKLGHGVSAKIKGVAESIVNECEGLPLMIISMARGLRGEDDIYEWRNALKELKGSRPSQENEKVFQILKFSYTQLKDPTLQQCFLYCALLGNEMKREEMILNLIGEGITGGMSSWQEEYDKGHVMLNKLVNNCLLQEDGYRYIKMHGLVRRMAIQVMKEERLPCMVEVHKALELVPAEKNWTEDIVRVSLADNCIKEISSNCSPRCPNLTSLLLHKNLCLESIEDSFFYQLHGLKVLNLSHTDIQKLPESVAHLKNLTALLLRDCGRLNDLPSLAALRALEVLDIYKTSVQQVPKGLETQSNLRYLNLLETDIEELPAGTLHNLSNLQFLVASLEDNSSGVNGDELARLWQLEYLIWYFSDHEDINKFFRRRCMPIQTERQQLRHCLLYVGGSIYDFDDDIMGAMDEIYSCDGLVKFVDVNISWEVFLPEDMQHLEIWHVIVDGRKGLCFNGKIELKSFDIGWCKDIEYIFSLYSSPSLFQSLETVKVSKMDNLIEIFGREGDDVPPIALSVPPINAIFSSLKEFTIRGCPRMKKLFPPGLLPNLQNLETLEVNSCEEMEEIAAEAEEQGGSSSNNHSILTPPLFSLPNLKRLSLWKLPKLNNICYAQMVCPSLQQVAIRECRMLRRIPISRHQLPSLQKIQAHPKEWWDWVIWDQSDEKSDLEQKCEISFSPY